MTSNNIAAPAADWFAAVGVDEVPAGHPEAVAALVVEQLIDTSPAPAPRAPAPPAKRAAASTPAPAVGRQRPVAAIDPGTSTGLVRGRRPGPRRRSSSRDVLGDAAASARRGGAATGRSVSRHRAGVAVAVAAVIVVAGGIGGAVWTMSRTADVTADPTPSSDPPLPPQEPPAAPSTTSGPPPWCPEKTDALPVTSASRGDLSTPFGPILQMQHGYYHRDVPLALDALAPGSSAAAKLTGPMQNAIPQVAPGTTHCVRIRGTDQPDAFEVDITERARDGAERLFPQLVTVARDERGRFHITAVTIRRTT